MNRKIIGMIPFKEKKFLVAEACLLFKRLKRTEEIVKRKELVSDSIGTNVISNQKTCSMFETVLQLLNPELALIIQNDFIDQCESIWYESNWSKTTYYKFKHEAIDQFLFLLYA